MSKGGRPPDDSDMKLGQASHNAKNTLYGLPQIQENLAIVRVTFQYNAYENRPDKVFDILFRYERSHFFTDARYDWAVVSVTIIR